MGKIDWKAVVNIIREDIVPSFSREGVRPTLRTIFYSLVSRNLIPNTKSSYKRLSSVLVKARKKGLFNWDFMEDRVRYAIHHFEDHTIPESTLSSLEKVCKFKLENLDLSNLLETVFGIHRIEPKVGFWAEQPVVPEVWVEKDALATTLDNWLADLYVNIRVNRGYSSWTFIYENVRELREILKKHSKIVILYCGDLDPSGIDIQRFINDAMAYFGLDSDVMEFRRIAVTPEQVVLYGLPPRPEDAETLAKVNRDPRSKNYSYDYIVELDALVAFAPSEFRKLLRDAIMSYHDVRIYDHVQKNAEETAKKCDELLDSYKREALKKILEQAKNTLD